MKKFFVFLALFIFMSGIFAADLETMHIKYLNDILSESYDNMRVSRGISYDKRSIAKTPQREVPGFRIDFSESLVAKIKNMYVKNDAIKRLDIFFRKNKVVIDGVFYLEVLDLDVPFTVVTCPMVPKGNVIYLDVVDIKLWSEGHLPSDKIIPKIVKFIAKNTDIKQFLKLDYITIKNGDKVYGRIKAALSISRFMPMLSDIKLTKIISEDQVISILGK
jgi:hypothetical protein